MRAKVQDMTTGSPTKLLVRFAIPLAIGNLFQQFYIMVDTMVVGKGVSVEALASVGAADWLNWLFLGMMTGLTQGFSIVFAHYFGAKNQKRLQRSVGNAFVLTVYFLIFMELFGQLGIEAALHLLQTPSDIIGGSILYLRILVAGAPVVLGYNLLAALLRAMGDSKNPLYSMLAAAFINVGLDLLFVMVFHWGIAGAAIATIIAQCFSLLWCVVVLRKMDFAKPTREDLRLERPMVIRLFRMAAPVIFQNSVIAVGGMAVQYVVNGFGIVFVAGFTATNKLYGLLETAAISFGFAMMTYAGQNMGAGKYARIRSGMRSGVRDDARSLRRYFSNHAA